MCDVEVAARGVRRRATSWSRSPRVADDAVDRGRDGARVLHVEEETGVAERLGDGGGRERDDRDAVVHRFEQRHAETLVLAAHDEYVGGAVVRRELGRVTPAGNRHVLVEPERVDEPLQRAAVGLLAAAADEVEVRVGVVEPPVRGERLDDVVLRLVRREATDEQPGDRVGAGAARARVRRRACVRSSRIGTTVVRVNPASTRSCSL